MLVPMKYLDSRKVICLGLRPSNLLINPDSNVKLSGFGFARTFTETDHAEIVMTGASNI
jgi:serine/threonine protein kinase